MFIMTFPFLRKILQQSYPYLIKVFFNNVHVKLNLIAKMKMSLMRFELAFIYHDPHSLTTIPSSTGIEARKVLYTHIVDIESSEQHFDYCKHHCGFVEQWLARAPHDRWTSDRNSTTSFQTQRKQNRVTQGKMNSIN